MITCSIKCRMKLHIHSQTSRAQPFKSGMERKCNSKLYKVCFTHQPWDYSHSMLVKGTPDCGTISSAATVMKTLQVFLKVSCFLNGVTWHFQFGLTIWSSNFFFLIGNKVQIKGWPRTAYNAFNKIYLISSIYILSEQLGDAVIKDQVDNNTTEYNWDWLRLLYHYRAVFKQKITLKLTPK